MPWPSSTACSTEVTATSRAAAARSSCGVRVRAWQGSRVPSRFLHSAASQSLLTSCCFACPSPPPRAAALGREALTAELRALSILHRSGCGARVVRPLAAIEWQGEWIEDEELRQTKWYFVSCCGVFTPVAARLAGSSSGCKFKHSRLQPANIRHYPCAAHLRLRDASVPAGLCVLAAERHLLPASIFLPYTGCCWQPNTASPVQQASCGGVLIVGKPCIQVVGHAFWCSSSPNFAQHWPPVPAGALRMRCSAGACP